MSSQPSDALSLDRSVLLAEAREKTGLTDFGDEPFLEHLDVLLDSFEREAQLNDVGRATQHARIVDSLATRLTVEDYIRRHPEILAREIVEPVVIVGLARTGTTMLHRLISSGPDFQAARWWEVRYPAPFATGVREELDEAPRTGLVRGRARRMNGHRLVQARERGPGKAG